MIIGLTGLNGAGKTEVAQYLINRGFEYHSLSDEIRAEIRRRGREITREVLISVGNELRNCLGPGVLAERVLQRLTHTGHYVVDSIRNPYEVEVLRRRPDFTFLAVEADRQIRFQRSLKRGREGAPTNLEQFVAEEARELNSEDPSSQQLVATRCLADVVVSNDGSVEDLHRSLDELLPRLMSRVPRPDWD
jgi:dephospho-CoA kinase